MDLGFPASYAGDCPECDERIEPGQLITHDGHGGYKHTVCPETKPEKPTRFEGTTLEEMGY